MTEPYTVVIEGQKLKALGWTAAGKFALTNGASFEITPLNMPQGTFRSLTLARVSKLTYTGGLWLLDGKPLDSVPRHILASPKTEKSLTEWFTRRKLGDLLKQCSENEPVSLEKCHGNVVAVAWLDQHYECFPAQKADPKKRYGGLFGETPVSMIEAEIPQSKAFTPVLLSAFHRVGQPTKLKPTTGKCNRVARFEKDFSLAIIPDANGIEKSLTVEPELRALLVKINEQDGQVPRTSLRKDKPDTWQPDKLFNSKVAKKLVKAGLMGKEKTGRTVTYWVKKKAD